MLKYQPQEDLAEPSTYAAKPAVVLSIDVEEHDRIEAARYLELPEDWRTHYAARMEACTEWMLETLAEHHVHATFFLVGAIGQTHPRLVRAIHDAGHEVAAHGHAHRRVHEFTPTTFAADLRQCRETLEQACGTPVVGYRAPTFSVMPTTAWAIDVLAEAGMHYDSSIFPVRHDRYGVPDAPRGPFWVRGHQQSLLELPLATLRLSKLNLPVAGGGYFRLFPLGLMRWGVRQLTLPNGPGLAMLYFHPWEFDPEQRRLPLGHLARWRTYTGIRQSRDRLGQLLRQYRFCRAIDAARDWSMREDLPQYELTFRDWSSASQAAA